MVLLETNNDLLYQPQPRLYALYLQNGNLYELKGKLKPVSIWESFADVNDYVAETAKNISAWFCRLSEITTETDSDEIFPVGTDYNLNIKMQAVIFLCRYTYHYYYTSIDNPIFGHSNIIPLLKTKSFARTKKSFKLQPYLKNGKTFYGNLVLHNNDWYGKNLRGQRIVIPIRFIRFEKMDLIVLTESEYSERHIRRIYFDDDILPRRFRQHLFLTLNLMEFDGYIPREALRKSMERILSNMNPDTALLGVTPYV